MKTPLIGFLLLTGCAPMTPGQQAGLAAMSQNQQAQQQRQHEIQMMNAQRFQQQPQGWNVTPQPFGGYQVRPYP